VNLIPLIIEPDRDDPDCASVLVDGTIAGRPYRFVLDTGTARTKIVADEFTADLPSRAGHSSTGVFAASANPLVTVNDLVVGPLAVPALEVERVEGTRPGARNLLGMDVLRGHCCHFRFSSSSLMLETSPATRADRALQMDDAGHSYVEVEWPGVTGHACWDSGAGITIVDRTFVLRHADLFEANGESVGTDSTGARAVTRTFDIAGPTIGGTVFARHKVAMVDLSQANAGLARPMDLILGYTTLRQADWLLDFPARRWTLTDRRSPTSAHEL
jgi:hypothetical protein